MVLMKIAVTMFLALAVSAVLFWVSLTAPWGRFAVRQACSESGGTHVIETVIVEGYFNETAQSYCRDCDIELAARHFDYIDVYLDENASDFVPGTPGYFRFELVSQPDARCEPWERTFSARHREIYGITKHECIALYSIDPSRLAEYEVAVRKQEPVDGPWGIGLFVNEQVIQNRLSGKLIASQRNYIYRNWLQRSLDDMRPAYECQSESTNPFLPREFRARVLANTSLEN